MLLDNIKTTATAIMTPDSVRLQPQALLIFLCREPQTSGSSKTSQLLAKYLAIRQHYVQSERRNNLTAWDFVS